MNARGIEIRLSARWALRWSAISWLCLPWLCGAAPASAPVDPQGTVKKGIVANATVANAAVEEGGGPICIVEVKTSINPGSGAYLIEALRTAKQRGCGLLLITLDTPGGLLQTTRDIVKEMLAATVPVAVHVTPAGAVAGSAGVFITLAAHVAAMAPGTNIGAAHPVSTGGKDVAAEGGKDLAKKVENDAVAFIEGIAEARGRNREWAIKAVRESVSITATQAVEEKVVDLLARDLAELQEKLEGRVIELADRRVRLRTRGQEVERIAMTIGQRVTTTIADPQIAYLLMTFGVLGIVMELYHPGSIFPGVFGSISLLTAFVSLQVLPINWGAVALIFLGLGLFVAELFITSHGLLGIGGGIAVVLGGLMLVDVAAPGYFVEPSFGLGLGEVLPLGLAMSGIAIFIASKVLGLRRGRAVTGQEALAGQSAVVREAITPASAGQVLLSGELWKAEADQPIAVGATVDVLSVEGLKVRVRARRGEKESG